jgi:hypothetical protein
VSIMTTPASNNTGLVALYSGIVGAATGLFALFISWLNFHYLTPKIKIDKTYLIVPDETVIGLVNRTIEDLKSSYLDFQLEIVVRNKRGGRGSIDKPDLVIEFQDATIARIPPETEEIEYKKIDNNTTETSVVRYGRSFNVDGGQKVDDQLEYELLEPETIHKIVRNFPNLKYYIEYTDHKGRRHKNAIKDIRSISSIFID